VPNGRFPPYWKGRAHTRDGSYRALVEPEKREPERLSFWWRRVYMGYLPNVLIGSAGVVGCVLFLIAGEYARGWSRVYWGS
jgi:hypothetical protein